MIFDYLPISLNPAKCNLCFFDSCIMWIHLPVLLICLLDHDRKRCLLSCVGAIVSLRWSFVCMFHFRIRLIYKRDSTSKMRRPMFYQNHSCVALMERITFWNLNCQLVMCQMRNLNFQALVVSDHFSSCRRTCLWCRRYSLAKSRLKEYPNPS